jgi:hypothetical protein
MESAARTARSGVVFVGDGSAENGHDRISDELLYGAAETLELCAEARMVRLQQPSHILRVLRPPVR